MCDFEGHKCKDAVWRSILVEEQVGHLSREGIEELFEELNSAVAAICEHYDVKE